MELGSGILDKTLGRFVAWLGGSWNRGRDERIRRAQASRDLLAAMGEFVANVDRLGRGMGMTHDKPYLEGASRAEQRVAALIVDVTDDELLGLVRSFLEDARTINSHRAPDWSGARDRLRPKLDAAADRIRELQRELD